VGTPCGEPQKEAPSGTNRGLLRFLSGGIAMGRGAHHMIKVLIQAYGKMIALYQFSRSVKQDDLMTVMRSKPELSQADCAQELGWSYKKG
jgi:hypothetical protein